MLDRKQQIIAEDKKKGDSSKLVEGKLTKISEVDEAVHSEASLNVPVNMGVNDDNTANNDNMDNNSEEDFIPGDDEDFTPVLSRKSKKLLRKKMSDKKISVRKTSLCDVSNLSRIRTNHPLSGIVSGPRVRNKPYRYKC